MMHFSSALISINMQEVTHKAMCQFFYEVIRTNNPSIEYCLCKLLQEIIGYSKLKQIFWWVFMEKQFRLARKR